MPKKDGTGPVGNGPITGRGRGKCIIPLNTDLEELTFLKNQEKVLREELSTIKTRIMTLKMPVSGRKK